MPEHIPTSPSWPPTASSPEVAVRFSLRHDGSLAVTVAEQATGRKVQADLGFRGRMSEGALRRRAIAGLDDHLPRPALLGGIAEW